MGLVQIEYLADHPEMASLLAAWHHAEWGPHYTNWSLEKACEELCTHTGRRQVPTTLVALEGNHLLGSVSLLAADLEGWDHLSPWLASLFVIPERRGQSLGKQLVTRVLEEAAALGFPAVYLWTDGQQTYYEGLRWKCLARIQLLSREVVIMRRDFASRANR